MTAAKGNRVFEESPFICPAVSKPIPVLSMSSPEGEIRNVNTALFVLVSVLAAGLVLGFYLDWFGLWVSKEELRKEIARAKERMRGTQPSP